MATQDIAEVARQLTDLELAVLLSLVAKEHCIIQTEDGLLNELQAELELIVSNIFGLNYTALDCSEDMALGDFAAGILMPCEKERSNMGSKRAPSEDGFRSQSRPSYFRSISRPRIPDSPLDERKIVNVVIAKHFNYASTQIQIQVLDVRWFQKTQSGEDTENDSAHSVETHIHSNRLLHCSQNFSNDHIFVSHLHTADDGFPNLEESSDWIADDRTPGSSSTLWRSGFRQASAKDPLISEMDIISVVKLSEKIIVSAEVKRYLHNIAIFLRLHRAVEGGVSARSTEHFDLLARCLAPLHSLDFVTPSLVKLAARKVYPHRIRVTTPEYERSMQYGSELQAVASFLDGIAPTDIIEDVLSSVEVPL
ncbi:MAG: hypothetical protein M1834_004846 [Cirrosporium novae-zelandiae]|nr:MAG: hypothetical protein M1834_004846 [Cirrosporium novae-zelandiae]